MARDGHRPAVAVALDSRATGYAAPTHDSRRQHRQYRAGEHHAHAPRTDGDRGAVVHHALPLYVAVPIGSRHVRHGVASRLVGCGALHLALLDGLRPRRRRFGGLGYRHPALRLALPEEPARRHGALAVLDARLDDAALLPTGRTVDRVPRPAALDG